MALVQNVDQKPLILTGGRTLAVGVVVNVDPAAPNEAALIAVGSLQVTDGTVDPEVPAVVRGVLFSDPDEGEFALEEADDAGLVLTSAEPGDPPVWAAPASGGSGSASGVETVNAVATSGSSQTLPDVTTATVHRLTLTAATCAITFPAAVAGHSFTVVLVQDATGGRLVTWPGTVQWGGGTTPVLTTTAAKRDVFSFLCADGTNWLGMFAGQNL